ncbi:MAG TPA: iron-containing alcohol dehydrogenase [bacterium]|nr:iron-containing alcohol dehydrogenase [bacterium]
MSYSEDLSFLFFCPTRIVYGVNTAADAGIEMRSLGCEKVILVTDPFLFEKTDAVKKIEKSLGSMCVGVFSDVPSDSGLHVVNQGYEFARSRGAEGVVSVGGGSVIDTAKGIAILLKEGGALEDYQGFQMLTRKVAPHVCLPTTAGTGSEVTYIAVIKDHQKKQKLLFGDHHIIPDVAILDPMLTVGLPPLLTAATGMDALSHATEAITSTQREPVADALGLHAIRLIRKWLPAAVHNGADLNARGQMLIASTLAGASFGNAQVGLVHAIAHTVGARHGVHHGTANAVAMPYVMRFNNSDVAGQNALIAETLGVDVRGMSVEAAGLAAADEVLRLNNELALPTTLKEVGVPESDLEECAQVALSDGAIVYNGKPVFDPDEVLAVIRKAWSGDHSEF